MSVYRYYASMIAMLVATACFGTLAVIDNHGWAILAVATAAWPLRGFIHYGAGR